MNSIRPAAVDQHSITTSANGDGSASPASPALIAHRDVFSDLATAAFGTAPTVKVGRPLLGRRSIDSGVDEIKASRSRSGINANRDDDLDDYDGGIADGRRHHPHRRWKTFPPESALGRPGGGGGDGIGADANFSSDVDFTSDDDHSTMIELAPENRGDETHPEAKCDPTDDVVDAKAMDASGEDLIASTNGGDGATLKKSCGMEGEEREAVKKETVAELLPPPRPPPSLLPFPPLPSALLSPLSSLPPLSTPMHFDSSCPSGASVYSDELSPDAPPFLPRGVAPAFGGGDGGDIFPTTTMQPPHQLQQTFSPQQRVPPPFGYGSQPVWNQAAPHLQFGDHGSMPPPPPRPQTSTPPPPDSLKSSTAPLSQLSVVGSQSPYPVPSFPSHGPTYQNHSFPLGEGAPPPPHPPHSNSFDASLQNGETASTVAPASSIPITPPQSPLNAITDTHNEMNVVKSPSSSPASSLSGDAPVFKPRIVRPGAISLKVHRQDVESPTVALPDVTKPPPLSLTAIVDATTSEMKGAYPSWKSSGSTIAPITPILPASVASVIDNASLSPSNNNNNSAVRGLHFGQGGLTDTQGRISFQVKSVSRISSPSHINVDALTGLRKTSERHHHHHHKSLLQPGSYSGLGGTRSGAKSMCIPRRENPEDFFQNSKLIEEDTDESFLDFIKQGGGTKEPFIDSHCHLDFLLDRSDYSDSFAQYMEENSSLFPPNLSGCVTNFCYPENFNGRFAIKWRERLHDSPVSIWQSWGCHPKKALLYTRETHRFLKEIATSSNVVSVGEIGLDYSICPTDDVKARQKKVFAEQCGIAIEAKKPLVIHCRDAQEDCLEVLKRQVPSGWKIHCHCFMEDWDDCLNKWLTHFKNLYIGLTNFRTTNQQRVARAVPLDRLLLETDAPYFVPRRIPRSSLISLSNPGMALFTALSVSNTKGIPLTEVLEQTRKNAKILYEV